MWTARANKETLFDFAVQPVMISLDTIVINLRKSSNLLHVRTMQRSSDQVNPHKPARV